MPIRMKRNSFLPLIQILFTLITFIHNHQSGTIDAISRNLNLQQLPENWDNVLGSCNGLVLLMNEDNIIFFINPTTLKYHRIPTFHLALPPGSINMYGLGYDSAGDDYKVVTLSRYYGARWWDFATTFVDVYSVKTGLWRRTQSSAHVPIWRLWFGSGVLVNGALHWMADKGSGPRTSIIVVFDLSNEKFSEVPTPSKLGNHDLDEYTIVALRGCLCVFSRRGDIWMMREYGVEESWTRFSITEPPDIDLRLKPLCFVSDDNVVLDVDGQELIVYNRKEDQWSYMMVDGVTARFDGTISFMESLVSPTFGVALLLDVQR